MFNIDSLVDIPNFSFVVGRLQEEAEAGIRLRGTSEEEYNKYVECRKRMRDRYGILEPSNIKEVLRYIKSVPNLARKCRYRDKVTTRSLVLKGISGENFIDDLLEYRREDKLIRGSCDTEIRPKIHLSTTNRITYYEPNLVAYDKRLFIPRNSGEYLIFADIRNQEPLIWVEMLSIKVFKPYLEAEGGFYRELFKSIYGRESSEQELGKFKGLILSYMYGSNLDNLRESILDIGPIREVLSDTSIQSARRDLGRSRYTRTKVCKTYFGTQIYPSEKSRGKETVAINLPIQGTAADIMVILLEHIYNELATGMYRDLISIYFTRYDEVVFRVSNEVQEGDAVRYIQGLMEHRVDDWSAFKVKLKVQN